MYLGLLNKLQESILDLQQKVILDKVGLTAVIM